MFFMYWTTDWNEVLVYGPRSYKRYLSGSAKGLKISGLNPDLCDAGTVLHQLSCTSGQLGAGRYVGRW